MKPRQRAPKAQGQQGLRPAWGGGSRALRLVAWGTHRQAQKSRKASVKRMGAALPGEQGADSGARCELRASKVRQRAGEKESEGGKGPCTHEVCEAMEQAAVR